MRPQRGRATPGPGECYPATGGAPQGCPLSGSAFALSTVPLLLSLSGLLGPRAVYAYADDIGLVIDDMGRLPEVAQTFEAFRRASGVELRLDKCKLIPLRVHGGAFEEVRDEYVRMLMRLVPSWGEVLFVPSALHLGFDMGPSMTRRALAQSAR